MDLKNLRKKIDGIDHKILALLNQRAEQALKVSELKKENNLGVYSAGRETNILQQLINLNKGPLSKEDIDIIFREIISVCRSMRTTLKVVYLGPQGTFTHMAAIKKFGKKSEYIWAESISDVFEKVENENFDYGVVPIENSIEGVINYTLDMFSASNLKICAEITLSISHSLLGLISKDKINRVYSNTQVFPQCRKWLSRNLAGVEFISAASTAKAALLSKDDSGGACIGNKILASLYGLKIIESSIEDSKYNYTRFLVVAKKDSSLSGKDKTSILFSIKDKVGALYGVLSSFKKYGINLTKIESRPSKQKPWEYYFFVDFQGHRESTTVQKALKDLEKKCSFVKILGSYPKET